MLVSFIYHDIVESYHPDDSGFPGAAANSYKLDISLFEAHLAAIHGVASAVPMRAFDAQTLYAAATSNDRRLLLTFDDGGVSAIHRTADLLEARGLRGCFFVATNYIGTKGFVAGNDVRSLHRRGHGIGTHSASHPLLMADCPSKEIDAEWRTSIATLSDLLGEDVAVGSVPGGSYGRNVAESAERCGLRVLFTSEPVTNIETLKTCQVLGRYSVKRSTSSEVIHSLATGRMRAILRERLIWSAKKTLKRLGGRRSWLKLRAKYFESHSSRERIGRP